MLNLRYLNYFVATAKEGGFARAAERINISKSAIVRAVDSLEEQFGTRLFVRQRAKGVQLTHDGELLLQMCQDLFQSMRSIEAKMSDLGSVSGQLVVACTESLAACIMPDLVMQINRSYPNLEINSVEATPDEAIEMLRKGGVDVLINAHLLYPGNFLPAWMGHEMLIEPLPFATLAADHPLAGRSAVTLEDLLEYPMILISKPYIAETSLLYFKRAGQLPKIAARTNTIENQRALIAKGLAYGITHFRPQVDRAFTGDRLITRPIVGVHPGISLIAGYANRNESWMPLKLRAFLEETRTYFASSTCRTYFMPYSS